MSTCSLHSHEFIHNIGFVKNDGVIQSNCGWSLKVSGLMFAEKEDFLPVILQIKWQGDFVTLFNHGSLKKLWNPWGIGKNPPFCQQAAQRWPPASGEGHGRQKRGDFLRSRVQPAIDSIMSYVASTWEVVMYLCWWHGRSLLQTWLLTQNTWVH